MYAAPYTLLGAEFAVGARLGLMEGLDAFGALVTDVFLAGNDLPDDGSLTMFNLVVGVHLLL